MASTLASPKAPRQVRSPAAGRKATPPAVRALELLPRLARLYPQAHCELTHRNAFELLVATVLSAQCTDRRVNLVTPALFARFPDARSMAAADQGELEDLVRSTGFFRSKARNLRLAAQAIVEHHDGEVPATMEALCRLPGVGRKTANVILGNAFGMEEGIVVDTHVKRLAKRLGLTRHTDPVKVESALVRIIPRPQWTLFSHWLIWHGRRRCFARNPDCPQCELRDLCPSASC